MAVKVRIQEDTMISIADAIREKYNAEDKYYPSEMAGKIEALPMESALSLMNGTIKGTVIDTDGVVPVISSYRFYQCSALTEVSFPVCTSIGNYAFDQCSALTEVSFPACTDIGSYAFYQCSALTEVSFPVCISMGANAFYQCSALTEVSFPACTSIGSYAFYSCHALESAYFMNSSVATLANSNVFTNTPMSLSSYLGYYGSIYVPASLEASYKTANNWSYYSDRIVGL